MMKRILCHPYTLAVEFFLLCLLVPGIIISGGYAVYMFAFLWGAAGYCFLIYRYYHFPGYGNMWHWDAVNWANMKPILLRWVLASIGMVIFLYFYDAARLFHLPLHNPEILPGLIIGYPVVSALPQELIFCTFFFARYQLFFGRGRLMIIMSALVFAYAHVLYINPVAPTLSLLGGLIFAWTYAKHKSLALVTIEHGLYGNSLFLTGLGWYFYSGAVGAAGAG